MSLTFETVDVFTDTRFGGNPLAVVFGAEAQPDAVLQRIAREFNYSETTFVLPPADSANTARVRIFTPKREIPFAGHPNVGTAAVLVWRGEVFGKPIGDRAVFEEGAGPVPIRFLRDGARVVGAEFTAPAPFEAGSEPVPAEQVAACLGLPADRVVSTRHRPVVGSVGNPFVLAELRDAEAVRQATPDPVRFGDQPAVAANGAILAYARSDDDTVDLRARMFAPLRNVVEDPATGSACAALMGLLGTLAEGTGTLRLRIAQGVEMGRPSLLLGEVDHADGRAAAVRVGGTCVPVFSGAIAGI